MWEKVSFENYFSIVFPTENDNPNTRTNHSILEPWPHYSREKIFKEKGFYTNARHGIMGLCHEKYIRRSLGSQCSSMNKYSRSSPIRLFPNQNGSKIMKLDRKGNFWAALNVPITNKDSKDQKWHNLGVEYM